MLTVQDLKLHARVDDGEEDDLMQRYLDAAKATVLDYLDLDALPVSPAIDAAVLLCATDLYERRARTVDSKDAINETYESLLRPYRRFA